MTESTFQSFQKFKTIEETLADLKSDFELGLKLQASLEVEIAVAKKAVEMQEHDNRVSHERDWLRHQLEHLKKESQENCDRRIRERERDQREMDTLRDELRKYRQDESERGDQANVILKREDDLLEEHHAVAKALNYQTAFGTLAEWAAEVKKVQEFQVRRADELEKALRLFMPTHCFDLGHRPEVGEFCLECSPHRSGAERINEIQKRVVLAEDCLWSTKEAATKLEKEVAELKTKLEDRDKVIVEGGVLLSMLIGAVREAQSAFGKTWDVASQRINSERMQVALNKLHSALDNGKAEVFYQHEKARQEVVVAAFNLRNLMKQGPHTTEGQQALEKAKYLLDNALAAISKFDTWIFA